MSVTVLILMLSLFHHNPINSSATCTTTSFSCELPCSQGPQAFKSPTRTRIIQDPLQLTVPPGFASRQSLIYKLSRFKTLCNFSCPQGSQAFRGPETSFPISSSSATYCVLSARKLPEFITRPSELERTNYFFANILAKITDEDTFDT